MIKTLKNQEKFTKCNVGDGEQPPEFPTTMDDNYNSGKDNIEETLNEMETKKQNKNIRLPSNVKNEGRN